MVPVTRQSYSAGFKALAVARVLELEGTQRRDGRGRPGWIRRVAHELGVAETTLRRWVQQADRGGAHQSMREAALARLDELHASGDEPPGGAGKKGWNTVVAREVGVHPSTVLRWNRARS